MSYYYNDKQISSDQIAFVRMVVDKYGAQVELAKLSLGEQKKFFLLFKDLITSSDSKSAFFRKLIEGTYRVMRNGESNTFKVI